jgi:hypothetical protein
MPTALIDGLKGGKWHSLMGEWPHAFFAREGLLSMSLAKKKEEGRIRRNLFGPLTPT